MDELKNLTEQLEKALETVYDEESRQGAYEIGDNVVKVMLDLEIAEDKEEAFSMLCDAEEQDEVSIFTYLTEYV